jgi:TrmH family RNA methyltransferase
MTKSDIKYIQSLAHKKQREEEGLFVVEGVKMVDELLLNFPDRIIKVYATETWINDRKKIVKKYKCFDCVDLESLERISFLHTANEVVALVTMPTIEMVPSFSNGVTLVLDQIQDPGNLGTIIRTADWFGVKQIICSVDTSDAFSPKVVQASMGSLMRLNIFYLELEPVLKHLGEVPIYTAELNGESLFDFEFRLPSVLVIGNESRGVSEKISKLATKKITIPKLGNAESLNASVASGIILSHAFR